MTYRKGFLQKFLIICAVSTTVTITQVALADYQPPDDQKPPQDSSEALKVKLYNH